MKFRIIYVEPEEPPEVLLERAFDAYCRILLTAVLRLGQERNAENEGDGRPAGAATSK